MRLLTAFIAVALLLAINTTASAQTNPPPPGPVAPQPPTTIIIQQSPDDDDDDNGNGNGNDNDDDEESSPTVIVQPIVGQETPAQQTPPPSPPPPPTCEGLAQGCVHNPGITSVALDQTIEIRSAPSGESQVFGTRGADWRPTVHIIEGDWAYVFDPVTNNYAWVRLSQLRLLP